MTRWSLLLLLAACTNGKDVDPVDTDSDTVDTDVQLSTCADEATVSWVLPEGDLAGEAVLELTLAHPEDTTGSVRLTWSADGTTFEEMTVAESVDDLAVSAEGTTHSFTWDTLADLAFGRFEVVTLRAVARSESCNPWPPAEGQVTADNEELPPPMCAVAFDAFAGPLEGMSTVGLSLSREEAATASVELFYSADGGPFVEATLAAVDCDGDGFPDGATGLEASVEGTSACLSWDSQVDLAADASIVFRVDCYVDGSWESSTDSAAVDLENDPAPSPGEVIVTEIMPEPAASQGHYIEVRNFSGHTLDLEGLVVGRWRAVTPLTNAPDREFTVDVATDLLAVEPGGYAVFAGSDDPVASGCRTPDALWPAAFSMNDDSTLVLSYDGVEISQFAFLSPTWSFDEGVAQGCQTAGYADACAVVDDWCSQLSAISGCTGLQNPGENGTPGTDNDVCPVP
jgi:hypothetical protein